MICYWGVRLEKFAVIVYARTRVSIGFPSEIRVYNYPLGQEALIYKLKKWPFYVWAWLVWDMYTTYDDMVMNERQYMDYFRRHNSSRGLVH